MNNGSTEIYDLLYRLGVTANYTGFFHTAYAVSLCAQQPDRLLVVTKWLYPEVAKKYRTKWKTVERNIRTVNGIIWRGNRPLLEELACRPLAQKPRNAQLLAILAAALKGPPAGEAEAFVGEYHGVGMADEPVNEGSGKAVAANGSVPLRELQARGDDEAPALAAV